MLETNQNKPERILRMIIAIALLPAPFMMSYDIYTYVIAGLGGILFFNAVSGACMTYKMFGVNTCPLPREDK